MRVIPGFLAQHEVEKLVGEHKHAIPGKRVEDSKRRYTISGAPMGIGLQVRALMSLGIPQEKMVDYPYCDSFFFHYGVGDHARAHLDSRSGFRVNVLLLEPIEGGVLNIDGVDVPLLVGDAVVFQPDFDVHGVSPVRQGERLVWSVGRAQTPRDTQLATKKGKK